MNRATFFKHFELLADHPDAVAKMRELVLELAVRGKLVSQNPKDEPAANLLSRINQEKDKLAKNSKNQTDALPNVLSDEIAFDVPPGWGWVRTQHVTTYVQRGKSPKYSMEQKVPVIAQKCIQWHGFELHKAQFIEPASLESYSDERFVLDGDLLWNSTGLGTLGRIIVFRERFKGRYPRIVADSHVTVIRPSKNVVPDYLFLWFAGPKVQKEINAKASGSTKQTELATSTVLGYPIPLPPLAEQRRIVAKVEELMALCDELEQRQEARQQAGGILQQSALHHLLAAREPKTFAAAWQRVRDHFHLLHDTPDAIPQLRQAILQLAVQGRLVPQNPKDEPAVQLLEHVYAAKQKVARVNGEKPPKVWPRVEPHEVEQTFPAAWVVARLGDLTINIEAGYSPQCEGRRRSANEWGVLKISAVSWDKFDPEENKALPPDVEPRQGLEVRDDDFLMSRANTAELVAKSVIAHKPPSRLLLNDKTLRVHFTEYTNKRFVNLVNNSLCARAYYAKASSGTSSSMKNITREGIGMLPVAIPPLAEQKRIVARVEELLRWCDTLEAQLHLTRTLGARLLDSTIHHLLAG